MQGRLLLNVVVRKGSSIFQLFTSENQTLLFRRDSFLVLDLRFHVLDGIVGLHVKGDRFTGQSLDEDLHGTTS